MTRDNEINHQLKKICINAGSSPGLLIEYREAANRLGRTLAENNIDLVYGGAGVGLMGEVANAAIAHGGKAIGVIPKSLAHRVAHKDLSQLHVVDSMHERKQKMFDLSDGFIALPGGLGTLEEVLEILTWSQLGLHGKPCGMLNICGYFDKLLAFIDHAVSQRFIRQEHRDMILVETHPANLLRRFRTYGAPTVEKWMDRE